MAQTDFFLKLDGVPGESADDKHKGEIDVESWSWGATQAGTMDRGGGGGAGKIQMQDFHFVMKVNKATPKLMLACAKGEHIPNAVFVARKAGGKQEEYLNLKFGDVMVSSYQTGGSVGQVIPMDQISLNFSKIEMEYKEQQKTGGTTGPVKAGWDVKANKVI
ncbi:MAG: Hcp family type VI secretion system effector [Thermoanaerobaculia bacterium]